MIPLEQVRSEYVGDRRAFESTYQSPVFIYQPKISSTEKPDDHGRTVKADFDIRKGYTLNHGVSLVIPLVHKPTSKLPIITIGRLPDNDIVVEHTNVSRFHAYLTRLDDVLSISDNGSMNGTFVKGVELERKIPRRLANQDVIHLGGLQSKVEFTYYDPEGFRAFLTFFVREQPVGGAR